MSVQKCEKSNGINFSGFEIIVEEMNDGLIRCIEQLRFLTISFDMIYHHGSCLNLNFIPGGVSPILTEIFKDLESMKDELNRLEDVLCGNFTSATKISRKEA